MGLNNDLHNTNLFLGLGISSPSSSPQEQHKTQNPSPNLAKISEPSLTLSLSGENYDQTKKFVHNSGNSNFKTGFIINDADNLYGQDHSTAASSLSNVSSHVKRERDQIGSSDFEVEIEKSVFNSSRASDEDDDGSNGRKKLRLTKAQSALLEDSFKTHSTLGPKQKQDLARDLKLRPRQVEVWFQNRRARTKLKQTEVDYEFMKKCCETLTDENRRLQKELHELKLAQPMYMQLPAATLTMCPSCERIDGGSAKAAAKSHFNMAPKPHFYNPFTNSSAAC